MEISRIILKLLLIILVFLSNPNTIIPTASVSIDSVDTTAKTASSLIEKSKAYIRNSCSKTIYPNLCYISLSPYSSIIENNPRKLCNTALLVALNAANNASFIASMMMKQRVLTRPEAQIVKDCIENIKDSVYELKKALGAMNRITRSNIEFQMSNVRTWISAAMTDQETCTDGFYEENVSGYVKNKIRNSIMNVARLTSNALALVNALQY